MLTLVENVPNFEVDWCRKYWKDCSNSESYSAVPYNGHGFYWNLYGMHHVLAQYSNNLGYPPLVTEPNSVTRNFERPLNEIDLGHRS